MYQLLLLASSLVSQPDTFVCPPAHGYSELISHAEASLGADLPFYVFCVYGSPDETIVWLHSIEA